MIRIKQLFIYVQLVTLFAIASNHATEDLCAISSTATLVRIYSPERFSGEHSHIFNLKELISVDLTPIDKEKIVVVIPHQIREKAKNDKKSAVLDFNARSTLFTAAFVLDMWGKSLQELCAETSSESPTLPPALEKWVNRNPIFIYPHVVSEQINASYTPSDRTLRFNFLRSSNTFMCQVFDVVSHEAGHGFLDTIQPNFNLVNTLWNGSLHESFGDISAIMSSMEIALSRFKFNEVSSFILKQKPLHIAGPSIIGCIRKPSDFVGFSIHEVHDTSNIFTKAFFESLGYCYKFYAKPQNQDSIGLVLRSYRKALLKAILSQQNLQEGNNDLLVNIANSLIDNLSKYLKFNPEILLEPFLKNYDSLTCAVIFDEEDMTSFGKIPVPSNILDLKYHPFG